MTTRSQASLGDRMSICLMQAQLAWAGLPAALSPNVRESGAIRHVTLEDRDAVLAAIDAFDKGLDFADALHGARSTRAAAFATLDRRLAKKAQGLALSPPVELLA